MAWQQSQRSSPAAAAAAAVSSCSLMQLVAMFGQNCMAAGPASVVAATFLCCRAPFCSQGENSFSLTQLMVVLDIIAVAAAAAACCAAGNRFLLKKSTASALLS
jgi:hypothetical protein